MSAFHWSTHQLQLRTMARDNTDWRFPPSEEMGFMELRHLVCLMKWQKNTLQSRKLYINSGLVPSYSKFRWAKFYSPSPVPEIVTVQYVSRNFKITSSISNFLSILKKCGNPPPTNILPKCANSICNVHSHHKISLTINLTIQIIGRTSLKGRRAQKRKKTNSILLPKKN